MSYSRKPVSILLIEDDKEHVTQIKARLGAGYEIAHFESVDDEKLYNYKALNQDSQIIIVDLVLRTAKEPDMEEGKKIIQEQLWPIDRTAFFIVFSGYIEEKTLPPLNTIEPHWTFVRKELDGSGGLTEECLARLNTIVERCKAYSSPALKVPKYEPYDWTNQIDRYQSPFDKNSFSEPVRENIVRSVNILNELAQAAAYYIKAGEPSRQLAIGIFGSCGRLEMRGDSDIECSVYYSDLDSQEPYRKLAVAFWNRITRFMKSKGWRYEGQEKVETSPTKLLVFTQADEVLQNKFYPVIKRDNLVKADPKQYSQYRNRHFQVLTELRPIFNPDFIFEMKKEIILKNCETLDFLSIVDSPYMEKLADQYSLDAQPETLTEWNDFKRFCYRTLNILALRMALIGKVSFRVKTQLTSDEDWREFLNALCDPGIIKVLRFAADCKELLPESPEKAELIKLLDLLIQKYFMISSRFSQDTERSGAPLRKDAASITGLFIDALKQMDKIQFFQPISTTITWLFDTEKMEGLKGRLFG